MSSTIKDLEEDNLISQTFENLSLTTGSTSSSDDSYIYVEDENAMDKFVKRVGALMKQNKEEESHIYVDCEGNDLGCLGGKLGLVQVGVENDIYLIDVIKYEESIPELKKILENENLVKVMWDARNDFSELWHGHKIHLETVLDLQLLRIYIRESWRIGTRGWIKLEGMGRAFSDLNTYGSRLQVGITDQQMRRMNSAHLSVKELHKTEAGFWIRRPLSPQVLDYATFDIIQLRALYQYYQNKLVNYPNLREESQRYAEIYKDQRPDNSIYFQHGLLPQEIFTRSSVVKRTYDSLGTRSCSGCRRSLHQDSFAVSFGQTKGQMLCYTCAESKRFRSGFRRPF